MNISRIAILASLILLVAETTAAIASLVNPHVYLSVADLYPYGSSGVWSAVYSGGYVYCAADGYANYCVDVTDPNNVHYSDRYIPGAGHAYQVVVWNGKLYAANWFTYLDVYDLAANPGKFTHLGNYNVPGLAAFTMDVGNGRAYIGESNWPDGGFRIINVSDPANMTTVSTSLLGQTDISGVAVRGSYAFLANGNNLNVLNISNESSPFSVSSTNLGYDLQSIKVRGNYAYITSVMPDGGLWIFDISDPLIPVQRSHILGPIGSIYLMGDYLFAAGGSNHLYAVNISNPSSPSVACTTNVPGWYSDAANGWEGCVTGQDRYIYVGANELYWINGNNEYKGKVYCLQAFDQDPDNIGPNKWSGFTPTEVSYETQYEGDALPTASSPAWTVYSGTEAPASVSSGVLRVNDTGSTNVRWLRSWDATSSRGATVLCRARCASFTQNEVPSTMGNIYLEDGRYEERFVILPTKIRASRANIEYALDGTQWHTYRITTQGTQFRVYVDESLTPALAGTLWMGTGYARVSFGAGPGLSSQDIYFDYLHCFGNGVSWPGTTITDATPDISVNAADSRDPGSVSGVSPGSARVYWSTDAGATWITSGGTLWDCQYQADALPSASTPAWGLADGSEVYGSVASGVLRVYDNSTAGGSKVKWSRSWNASSSRGVTVFARVRCAAIGGDHSLGGNIYIEDGSRKEFFKIRTDRIETTQSFNASATYDATQWHDYRITAKNGAYSVYLDENPTPILMGSMVNSITKNRLMIGSGASAGTQDIYFDYVWYTSNGDLLPGEGDGGGPVNVVCFGSPGDEQAGITAYGVPFNQRSETLNKIRFSVKDVNGNQGYSPIHNVRILPGPEPPAAVSNFTATSGDMQVNLSWHTPPDTGFSGTMIRYKTGGYPYGANDGTLLVNKAGTPNSDDSYTHTCLSNDGTTYYYSAFAYDSVPNYSPKADASAVPTGAYWFSDTFTYPNGYLNGSGCWSGSAGSPIAISSQTVKITGGSVAADSARSVSTPVGGAVQVRVDIQAGAGTQTMWGLWVDDPAGANLARWYGSGTTARGRIGGTSSVTVVQTLSGGWDRLDVRINTATNQSEFFVNDVSIGSLDHSISGAGNQVGKVWFERIDNLAAMGNTIYFDNLRLGPADTTPPGPVTGFKAGCGDGAVSLSWTNPIDADFAGTKILYKTTGYPASVTDGTVVYNGSETGCTHDGVTNGTRYYYSAFTYDAFANYSSAAHAVTTPAVEATIAQAKALDNGRIRLLKGKVVSASFTGFFYLQEPGSMQGIRVLSPDSVGIGNLVDVVGALGGAGSERYLDTGGDNVIVTIPGPGAPPPQGLPNRILGGGPFNANTPGVKDSFGVNNIGLLVRVWGRVTATGDGFFYIDDGSGIADTRLDPATSQPYKGVRIQGSASASAGEYWAATGISICDVDGSYRIRAVLSTSTLKLDP